MAQQGRRHSPPGLLLARSNRHLVVPLKYRMSCSGVDSGSSRGPDLLGVE